MKCPGLVKRKKEIQFIILTGQRCNIRMVKGQPVAAPPCIDTFALGNT
jgi:hypothetical protein